MKGEQRLKGTKRLSLVHEKGRTWVNRLLVLKTISNDLDRSRFAFLAGKRIGNAVVRNRVKRRLREIVRLAPIKGGRDGLLIARRQAANADYHQLKRAADDVLKGAGLLPTQREADLRPSRVPAITEHVSGGGDSPIPSNDREAEE